MQLIRDGKDSTGAPFVSAATHFFSYAWKYSWKVVFTALQSFEMNSGGEMQYYYMIDQFCLNQHLMTSDIGPEEMQKLLVSKLRHSIALPNRVLMLLHPYDAPIVLSRAW